MDTERIKKTIEFMQSNGSSLDDIDAYAMSQGLAINDTPAKQMVSSVKNALTTDENSIAPSKMERLGRGIVDAPSALAQFLINSGYKPPTEVSFGSQSSKDLYGQQAAITPDELAEATNRQMANDESNYQYRRGPDPGIDMMRGVGTILGSAPVMALGGAPATLGRSAITGMGQGFVSGALTPVVDGNDYFGTKTNQVGVGTAVGGFASPAMTVLSKLVSGVGSRAVNSLAAQDIKMTLGQIIGPTASRIEEKFADYIPFVSGARQRAFDSFNSAAYNRVIKPLNDLGFNIKLGAEVGDAGVTEVAEKVSGAYQKILPNLKFNPDNVLKKDLEDVVNDYVSDLAPDLQAQFRDELERRFFRKIGPDGMTGEVYQAAASSLKKAIDDYSGALVDPEKKALGESLQKAYSAIQDNLKRNNPDFAPALKALDRSFATLARIKDATQSALASNEGKFTPAQLLAAVKRGDNSGDKLATLQGKALLSDLAKQGQKVLGNKVPNSGTAGRMLPQTLGLAGLTGLGVGGTAIGAGALAVPTAAAIGAGSLLYTNLGQKMAQGALIGNRGGPVNDFVARTLQKSAPAIGIGGARLFAGNE